MELIITLILLFIAWQLIQNRTQPAQPSREPAAEAPSPQQKKRPLADTPAADDDILAIAESLGGFLERSAYPADLLKNDIFKKGVDLLASDAYPVDAVLSYYHGSSVAVGCMALEAMINRADTRDKEELILPQINEYSYWKRYFALRYLSRQASTPLIGKVLISLDDTWTDQLPMQALRDFIQGQLEKGETLSFAGALAVLGRETAAGLADILKELGRELNRPLIAEFEAWQSAWVDVDFLAGFGRLLVPQSEQGEQPAIEHDALNSLVDRLESAFLAERRRSIILVGESGVGKTIASRVLGRRLLAREWTVFEAGASDIMAGQMYIGQLEDRVQQLVKTIGNGRKVLWIVPNFHELRWAGTHRHSATGLLDMIYTFVENGEILLLGETRPLSYENLLQDMPRLRTSMDSMIVEPLPAADTLNLVGQWAADRAGKKKVPLDAALLQEGLHLTGQYLAEKASPGNLIQLFDITWSRLSAGNKVTPKGFSIDDLLVTLSQLTGLPVSILDEREGLDLDALRTFFNQRVMGQSEAIDCLTDRVAMIKAGVTDPSRPSGVFLFAGPTGTGKTEIAKALADFLFGSEKRMIRLDMSEFQSPDSLGRILGETNGMEKGYEALVNQVRKQPFSVILLDEFEKAAPNIWDLFLQVFDDGRLTDRRGNLADFRHAIIIMTSNLGGAIPRGESIGFGSGAASGFTASAVDKAIERTFRKEFINRIDRLVVFQPLSRAVMREVLRKELNAVMQRRGLRNRTWAVEWDTSAIDFLLDKGFTADLGARPLKRAIDRFLLSPLAMTIVNNQFPEGDQFLFVRSGGNELEVEFVDPDATESENGAVPAKISEPGEALSLAAIVLDSRPAPERVSFLQNEYDRLNLLFAGEAWQSEREEAMARMADPEFWNSPDRYRVLGLIEYKDRMKTAFATATSLFERLYRKQDGQGAYSPALIGKIAHQLYLVHMAFTGWKDGHANDAFIRVRAVRDSAVEPAMHDQFARRISGMYVSWAEKRRMRYKVILEKNGSAAEPLQMILAVSGFGSYTILEDETGTHVLEITKKRNKSAGTSVQRSRAEVLVVPQPDIPAGNEPDALYNQALQCLSAVENSARTRIVRRYSEGPSPLVRDLVKKWRSGRFDLVIGGDFDLIGEK